MIARTKRFVLSHSYRISRVRVWLNRNFVLLLLISVAFFAYQNAGFQKDNKQLLENDAQVSRDIKKVLCEGIPEEDCQISKAVRDLKENDRIGLIITCKLFFASSATDNLTASEESVIEEKCKEQVQKQQEELQKQSGQEVSSDDQSHPQEQPAFLDEGSQDSPAPGNQDDRGQEVAEPPEPTGIAGIVDDVSDTVRAIVNSIFGGN